MLCIKTLRLVAASLVLVSSSSLAAGYTNWAVPTSVEMVNGGLLVGAAFGDPNNCGVANHIFVSLSNPNFKEIVGMAFTALAASRELQFWAGECTQVSFHWSGNVINKNLDHQTVSMR